MVTEWRRLGAIVGSLNNTLVAHIEGGELSGTVDELIRHSVSKLSHIHFVSMMKRPNDCCKWAKLLRLFYDRLSDIDIMFSNTLPNLEIAKAYYQVDFEICNCYVSSSNYRSK
jgi:UDP-N-acetylglucosamine 2-epimerase (hydrolysing)